MNKTLLILCLFSATLCCAMSFADEPSDALSARIDRLVREKWSDVWIGHHYSDPQVGKMRKQASRISFPARDGTAAQALGISDPQFFVAIRECGFSLISVGEWGATRTTEICRLNTDYELVVVRLTLFPARGKAETTELSAVIRRVMQSK